MKYLVVLAVILAAVWLWRSARARRNRADSHDTGGQAAAPEDMVRCPVCDVYLPRAQAIAGTRGLYCGVQHRLRVEG